MARFYPQTPGEFSRISGVGDKKLHEFGEAFLGEIAAHLQSNPRQIFADDSFAEPATPAPRRSGGLNDTARDTLQLFRSGKTVAEIARIRGLKAGTIASHIEEAILAGEKVDMTILISDTARREITAAFTAHGFVSLGRVVEALQGKYDYGQCRLVRAAIQAGL